ncbi:MAG: S8 family serine peptidase [Nocardioides sp.]|nr:S8 family serine peptidase [Nocardioides sp.]
MRPTFRALTTALGVATTSLALALGPATVDPGAAPVTAATPQGDRTNPTSETRDDTYLVTLRGAPAASYGGSREGLAATRPAAGERFDRRRPAVAALVSDLERRQDAVLASLSGTRVAPTYRYTTALNGFAADLRTDQVKSLRADDRVVRVERSTRQRLQSGDATGLLGLPGDGGAWAAVGGSERAGAGVVVGSIDSGLWPGNPGFAALTGGARTPEDFTGSCREGPGWPTSTCNSKIVAADWFVSAFGEQAVSASEDLSPRDTTGHGSHNASVAAGAPDVTARAGRQPLGRISGVAPAARIAVYKACWTAPDPDEDGCETADLVAAVDQAVGDGVDVLDVPVGTTAAAPHDTLSDALRHATAAGVFVAAPAGNHGPARGTVSHPAPWVATTAASTHQERQGAVVLGDGTRLVGAMIADSSVTEAPLVAGQDAATEDTPRAAARRCQPGSLDADMVTDAVVVCERGVVARVEKSRVVADAGGAGMVLVNPTPQSVSADIHAVPTVHLDDPDGRTLRQYLAESDDPVGALDHTATDGTPVPQVPTFSARGPGAEAEILKPDLAAPGVGVVGATSPTGSDGRLWDLRSGTSVASAHLAGLAALIRAERPTWSPARIKSALMTTAFDVEGSDDPFTQGAGHVDPVRALDPGVVLDVRPQGFRRYATGRLPARALNLPSVAVDGLLRTTVVRRTLTNVAPVTESYSAAVSGLPGITARVRPATVTLAPGESRTVRIRLTRNGASAGVPSTGAVTWVGQTERTARIPVVVRPAALEAPGSVRAPLASGSATVRTTLGAARVPVQTTGLVGALPTPLSLVPQERDTAEEPPTSSTADTLVAPLEVAPGTRVLRVVAEANSTGDDLDIRLYRGGRLVAEATGSASREELLLEDPVPGDYQVVVHAAGAANGTTTTGRLFTWTLGTGGSRSLVPDREALVGDAGNAAAVDVEWGELDPTQRWFGAVTFGPNAARTYLELR